MLKISKNNPVNWATVPFRLLVGIVVVGPLALMGLIGYIPLAVIEYTLTGDRRHVLPMTEQAGRGLRALMRFISTVGGLFEDHTDVLEKKTKAP